MMMIDRFIGRRLAFVVVMGAAPAWACPPDDVKTEGKQQAKVAQPVASTSDDAPVSDQYRQQQKDRIAVERQMRKIRATYFGSMKNKEIRQIGISRLQEFTDAQHFPSLLSIYDHEGEDVRTAIIEHLADQKTDEGDATIAWGAVHDREAWFREAAARRLAKREEESGKVPNMVKWVIWGGLKSPSDDEAGAAAELAGTLKLYEAIPAIINAQIRGGTGPASDVPIAGESMPAIADIIIATQQAFVADLTPVVGDSAVAFDPTLAVVTDGTYLRILGASVITYRTIVNRALIALADSGWDGRSTAGLGWDSQKWNAWYANEFKPYRAKVEAQAGAAKAAASPKP